MEADWGLEAVVRGCSTTSTAIMDIQEDIFNPFPHDHIFETSTALDKLEELYKPFLPVNLHPLVPSPTIPASSVSVPKQVVAPEKKRKDLKDSAPKHNKRLVEHIYIYIHICDELILCTVRASVFKFFVIIFR